MYYNEAKQNRVTTKSKQAELSWAQILEWENHAILFVVFSSEQPLWLSVQDQDASFYCQRDTISNWKFGEMKKGMLYELRI